MLNSHTHVNVSTPSTPASASSVTGLPARRMPDWLQASLLLGGLLLCCHVAVSSAKPSVPKTAFAQTQAASLVLPLRALPPHLPFMTPEQGQNEGAAVQTGMRDTRPNQCTLVPITMLGTGHEAFPFAFAHNSHSRHFSELGSGWTHSLDITGVFDLKTKGIRVHWGDDSSSTFRPVKTAQGLVGKTVGTSDALTTDADGTFTITRRSGIRYHLDHRLCCDRIGDASGHALTLERNLFGCVTRAQDGEGHELHFMYAGGNHLMAIQDERGRHWLLHFAPRQQTLDLTDMLAVSSEGLPTATHIDYDTHGSIAVVRHEECKL